MKKVLLFCAAIVFSISVYGQQIPNVKVEDQKGETVEMASFIDNRTPVIISFWSTICKPCLLELDALNEQYDDWSEEVDFRIIAVSVDDARSSSKAKSLASGRGWDFTVLYDKNQDFQRAMNVTSMPHVFIMDKDGNIVYSHNGYTPGSELELLKKLKELR